MIDGKKSNLSKENVIASCENSLRNLNTEYIDLLQVHYHDPNTEIEDTIEGFEQLKKKRKIREYGIGHLQPNIVKEYLTKGHITTVLAELSVLSFSRYLELEPLFNMSDFKIISFSVTGRGILSGKYDINSQFNN